MSRDRAHAPHSATGNPVPHPAGDPGHLGQGEPLGLGDTSRVLATQRRDLDRYNGLRAHTSRSDRLARYRD